MFSLSPLSSAILGQTYKFACIHAPHPETHTFSIQPNRFNTRKFVYLRADQINKLNTLNTSYIPRSKDAESGYGGL